MSDKISLQEAMDSAFYRLEKLEKSGLKKLWENPDTTAIFDSQTISLNSDDYDYLIVIGFCQSGYLQAAPSTNIVKGMAGTVMNWISMGNSGIYFFERDITLQDDTHLNFDGCWVSNTPYGQGIKTRATNNIYLIPYMILGGKFAK